jgi:hypothetical protein
MTAVATDALWGSTPIKTFMRVYLRSWSDLHGRAKDIPTSCGAHTSFESPRTSGTGGTQAENKPTHFSWATGSSRAIPETGTLEA